MPSTKSMERLLEAETIRSFAKDRALTNQFETLPLRKNNVARAKSKVFLFVRFKVH